MRGCKRRTVLATTGGLAASLAGCLGGSGGDDGDSNGKLAEDHAATRGIENEPLLGPEPAEARASMVVYDGPACTECHTYDKNAFPKIKSDLIEPGKVAYFGRLAPEYAWGKTASNALEAVTARDGDAYWPLLGYYLDDQSSFNEDNVIDRTRSFVAENLDMEADAVVEDVRQGTYQNEVAEDKQSWKDAGGTARPMVFIFKDGDYVTKVAGPQDYAVYENALDL